MTIPPIIIKSAGLFSLLIITLGSDAWGQGATGGSLGNDNKSLSGSSSEPRAAKPARRERSEPRAAPASRRSDDGGGSVARFDGSWLMTFTGQSSVCAGKVVTSPFTISGGKIGQGGSVSPSGAMQGVGSSGGVSAVMTGRLSSRSGTGSMQLSNGCTGRWTMSKQ